MGVSLKSIKSTKSIQNTSNWLVHRIVCGTVTFYCRGIEALHWSSALESYIRRLHWRPAWVFSENSSGSLPTAAVQTVCWSNVCLNLRTFGLTSPRFERLDWRTVCSTVCSTALRNTNLSRRTLANSVFLAEENCISVIWISHFAEGRENVGNYENKNKKINKWLWFVWWTEFLTEFVAESVAE